MKFLVFVPGNKYADGHVDTAPSASDLLIVGHKRIRSLVVYDEPEVRFIESHSKGRCRHQRLDLVLLQTLFQELPVGVGVVRELGLEAWNSASRSDTAVVGEYRAVFRVADQPVGHLTTTAAQKI